MAEVKLKNISKMFGDVVAVDDFSLDIKNGEFIILVGPSGCGKSTTLRAIAGLEDITSGDIHIGDRIVTHLSPKDRDIAMVFQNYALYPHMNVFNNLAFALKIKKLVPKNEIKGRVEKTAALLGIEPLLERKPKELSGGQRQRVALGRAIIRQPEVFLFDEPLSNLDAKLRINMRAELLDLHQRLKVTTVYVTHDQLEAMTMGDRIVIMSDGLIQQVGPPDDIYNHPINKFVAGFVGSPTMNFLDCLIERNNGSFFVTASDLNLKIPKQFQSMVEKYENKKVELGIRPEHINIRNGEPDSDTQAGKKFNAKIWVVEHLGSDKLLHIKNGENTLVARIEPHLKVKSGESAVFFAKMEFAHIFDKESGATVF
jgi:multiple sugar transport system ATP-binding protein